ncbi:MAG: tonB-system energizer ExbB [Beijerinckiaceae bacterium]|nr:tonB-system energizer ExbB [Beijerinckiaceae bacterium]
MQVQILKVARILVCFFALFAAWSPALAQEPTAQFQSQSQLPRTDLAPSDAAPTAAARTQTEKTTAQPPADTPRAASMPATMPHDLSPWGMFMQADIVVKAVMVGLAFACLVTWVVWLAKSLELFAAVRKARSSTRKLQRANSLQEAAVAIETGWTRKGPVAELLDSAQRELRRSSGLASEGVKERLAIALSRIEASAGRDMIRGTGVLATIGATAPFVGLFGTVWGIMNSFIGISISKTTNLAVVAPGIAEALLATAIGLVAAIPAVIIYNVFGRSIAGYRALLSNASGEILQHVSRDLDRAIHNFVSTPYPDDGGRHLPRTAELQES